MVSLFHLTSPLCVLLNSPSSFLTLHLLRPSRCLALPHARKLQLSHRERWNNLHLREQRQRSADPADSKQSGQLLCEHAYCGLSEWRGPWSTVPGGLLPARHSIYKHHWIYNRGQFSGLRLRPSSGHCAVSRHCSSCEGSQWSDQTEKLMCAKTRLIYKCVTRI